MKMTGNVKMFGVGYQQVFSNFFTKAADNDIFCMGVIGTDNSYPAAYLTRAEAVNYFLKRSNRFHNAQILNKYEK